MGVGGEEEVLVDGEGDGVGGGAGADGGDEVPVVDAVEADGVGAEVGDPEGGVVCTDDGVGRFVADGEGAFDLVVPGVDLGDGVVGEVGGEDLAAVGLEGEIDGVGGLRRAG